MGGLAQNQALGYSRTMALGIPQNIREFLKAMGRYGGRVRAQKYSKEQLAEWGRAGGRPKKSGAKTAESGAHGNG